jgi:hypothetical protein
MILTYLNIVCTARQNTCADFYHLKADSVLNNACFYLFKKTFAKARRYYLSTS